MLKGEDFDTLLEAKVLVERWRREYNQIRPHSVLGNRPPAPGAIPMRAWVFGSVPLHLPPMHIGQTLEVVQHMWAGHLKELIEA
jgi:hypothetical protein